jgi:Di-haem oxidoreductase, putative peroxidase
VADVQTTYDRSRGIFNGLYATASLQVSEQADGSGYPAIKYANLGAFEVRNFFSDLKRHDLGAAFYERNFDGTLRTQFMTTPLWGVGSTAPYGHDGRSINLREVILRHGGEAIAARNAFAGLPDIAKIAVFEYLNTLVLFPPDDTASNLDPGNPNAVGYPQRGHGSIRLPVLFNNPLELE